MEPKLDTNTKIMQERTKTLIFVVFLVGFIGFLAVIVFLSTFGFRERQVDSQGEKVSRVNGLMEYGDFTGVIEALESDIAMNDTTFEIQAALARALVGEANDREKQHPKAGRQEFYKESLPHFRRALEIGMPVDYQYRHNFYSTYFIALYGMGLWDEAQDVFGVMEREFGLVSSPWLGMAEIYISHLNKPDEAFGLLSSGINEGAASSSYEYLTEGKYWLMRTAAVLEKYETVETVALELLDGDLRMFPQYFRSQVFVNLGMAYAVKGDIEKAVSNFDQAKSMYVEPGYFDCEQARAYEVVGDNERAAELAASGNKPLCLFIIAQKNRREGQISLAQEKAQMALEALESSKSNSIFVQKQIKEVTSFLSSQ